MYMQLENEIEIHIKLQNIYPQHAHNMHFQDIFLYMYMYNYAFVHAHTYFNNNGVLLPKGDIQFPRSTVAVLKTAIKVNTKLMHVLIKEYKDYIQSVH